MSLRYLRWACGLFALPYILSASFVASFIFLSKAEFSRGAHLPARESLGVRFSLVAAASSTSSAVRASENWARAASVMPSDVLAHGEEVLPVAVARDEREDRLDNILAERLRDLGEEKIEEVLLSLTGAVGTAATGLESKDHQLRVIRGSLALLRRRSERLESAAPSRPRTSWKKRSTSLSRGG